MYRSTEYLLPQSLYWISCPLITKRTNTLLTTFVVAKCPTIAPVLFTATVYQPWTLCVSLTHSSTSPAALYIQGSFECNNLFQTPHARSLTRDRIPELSRPSANVLKIFLAHPYNYKFFFCMKFFPMKYFQLEYFPIYGITWRIIDQIRFSSNTPSTLTLFLILQSCVITTFHC